MTGQQAINRYPEVTKEARGEITRRDRALHEHIVALRQQSGPQADALFDQMEEHWKIQHRHDALREGLHQLMGWHHREAQVPADAIRELLEAVK